MEQTILITDDDKSIREYYKELLSENGYTVITAENGAECLNVTFNESVSMILLDINLPDINGLELLKRIKCMNDEIPVLLLSAHEKYKRNFASLYAEEYLVKDKKTETILRKIHDNLHPKQLLKTANNNV